MSEQGKGRKRSYISIDLKSFYASVATLPHFRYQSVQTRKHQYGRRIPKHAHGTRNLDRQTSSTSLLKKALAELYDQIVNPNLLIRRINMSVNRVVDERKVKKIDEYNKRLIVENQREIPMTEIVEIVIV